VDEVDIAAERMEIEMERLLKRRAASGPKPTGACLWCGEPVETGRRWCDADCRDDWERDHAHRR
jgi:hypothetical protein